MFASGEGEFGMKPGNAALSVVTEASDALFERATAAGTEVVQGLKDEGYGSRGFTVRDPEGNLWSFPTYQGAWRLPGVIPVSVASRVVRIVVHCVS